MLRAFTLLTILVGLGCIPAAAASYTGVVVDETGAPLIDATVVHARSQSHDHTDALGRFALQGVETGDTILVYAVGYTTGTLLAEPVLAKAPTRVTLRALALELPTIEIRPAIDAARAVQQLDIRTRPATNSQELLQTVPGLFIGQHAGGGKAEQLFLRGFDIDHGTDVSIAVDGAPVNMVSHAHGQGYADLHFVIPETVQEIEFVKGPYEVRAGNFATAASVELRTVDRLRENLLRVEGGQFGFLRAVAMVEVLDRARDHAYVAVEGLRTDGPFESSQDFTRLNAFAKTQHELAGGAMLTTNLSHFTSEWLASGQIPDRAVADRTITRFGAIDDTEGGSTSRSNANVRYQRPLGDHGVLSARAYGARYGFELYSNFTFFLVDSVNGDQIRQREDRWLGGGELAYDGYATLGRQRLDIGLGVQARFDRTDGSELSRTLNRTTVLERIRLGDIAERSGGAFATVGTRVGRWTPRVGLRVDATNFAYVDALEGNRRTAATAARVNPKVELGYALTDRVQLYAKTGRGYHANDARLIATSDERTLMPQAWGSDLGLTAQLGKRIVVTAAAWTLASEQEFVYVGDAGVVEPSGRSLRRGFDLGARFSATQALAIGMDLSAAQARAIDEPVGARRIPLAPPLVAQAFAIYQPAKGLHASARYRLMADRPADETYSLTAEGYQVVDLTLGYTFRTFSLDLVVDNAFDVAWNETQFATESRLRDETSAVEEIHFTPGTPRAMRGRLTWRF